MTRSFLAFARPSATVALACLFVTGLVLAGGAQAAPESFYGTRYERQPSPNELTDLGRVLFSEAGLSVSGRLSCASCHDPAHAYGPPNRLAVQLGGPDLRLPGVRAVPSLKYQQDTPPFTEHYNDTDGDDGVDLGPTGGRGWDGRAESAHEQAAVPLLSPFEMGNRDPAAVIERLRRSASAPRFLATFGPHALDDTAKAWTGLRWSLEVFQQDPAEFYPYTSKYDAVLRHQATLTPQEARGLALFNDANKANCATCHLSEIKRGAFPQFTDRGLIAIGVPRNPAIPANADPNYRDLGLCGPLRTDLKDRPSYCGLFKTPSLRNVATRSVFFHNGVYRTLDQVMHFYAERVTDPARIYGRDARGQPRTEADLPHAYTANLNREPPFDRRAGQPAVLTPQERHDIVAFLRTLTDGYVPVAAK